MIKTVYLAEIIKHHQNNMPMSSGFRCFYATMEGSVTLVRITEEI